MKTEKTPSISYLTKFGYLTERELTYIAAYTVQKIKAYPPEYGKTIENYFDVLYQDEIKVYVNRREINTSKMLKKREKSLQGVKTV